MARKKKLLWQLYTSFLMLTFTSLAAAVWYSSHSLKQFFLDQTKMNLEARAYLFEKQILEHIDPLDEKDIDSFCKKIGRETSTRITVILPSGQVVGDSDKDPGAMDNHVDRPEFIAALGGNNNIFIRYSRTLDKDMMYIALPVKKDGNIVAVIRTAIPVDAIDDALKKIQIKIAFGGLIIAVLAAIISLVITRRVTLPIKQIKRWAESVANGDFQFKPAVIESEEISVLSDAMNHMSTELRERLSSLMQQRNEIEAVLSSMVEGVIAVDMDEHFIKMNAAAAAMFGCNPSGIHGRGIQEVIRNTELQRFITQVLNSHKLVEKDIMIYSDGEKYLNGHGTLLLDAKKTQIGALIVLNDVTHIRKLENIRQEFAANVSHEIKTPITAIKGFVETLRDGALKDPENADRFLKIIEKHVTRLEAIIDDLLSLSRIEKNSGKEGIDLTEGRIKDVIEKAVYDSKFIADSKKIKIERNCDDNIRAKFNAPLLEQAVVNLLENAIKYSDEQTEINIKVNQTEDETIINVIDHGIGIEKKHLPRLFERFYRVDNGRSRDSGGTGLGLAIVKHIVLAHGGRISVESTPKKGSSFVIHLP